MGPHPVLLSEVAYDVSPPNEIAKLLNIYLQEVARGTDN